MPYVENKPPIILDCTLREGEQHPGVRFSTQEKIALLKQLEAYGVSRIEIGHPGISKVETERCTAVVAQAERAETLVHSRAQRQEIQAALDTDADWIGIWLGINTIALNSKFTQRDKSWVCEQASQAVAFAKQKHKKVRFTIEDASRTEQQDQVILAECALAAGADCISLADTVGIWLPQHCSSQVKFIQDTFNCSTEVHLHNDLGLALANALAAIDAGVDVVDTSILGIGERCGITSLIELVTVLTHQYQDDRFGLAHTATLVKQFEQLTAIKPDQLRPLVGQHAFTHTSTYHVNAMQRDPNAYQAIDPKQLGRKQQFAKPIHLPEVDTISTQLRIGTPFTKGAAELPHHRNGPGQRWVMIDDRTDPRASLYIIKRIFKNESLHHLSPQEQKHVDSHSHHCDSVFLFWGHQQDGRGLVCEVTLDNITQRIISPASVFIPAGVPHTYRYCSGSGQYWNIVLAPNYPSSLQPKSGS